MQSEYPIGNARKWATVLESYRDPNHIRSVAEILVSAVSFVLLWALMWPRLSLTCWLTLLLAFPAAGFLVRMFLIQHDCGHGAFIRHLRATIGSGGGWAW